ncbi:hypothetical protein CSB20_12095 [bacterium DOLZORAL124_64_63]|nr:MAG: hypothetical protein CSB20_12095 [bacterium DOLZORAL124_64_63]
MTEKPRNKATDPDRSSPFPIPEAPDEVPSSSGFPERPDGKKLDALQDQLHRDRRIRRAGQNNTRVAKYTAKVGKSVRDIGTYTLIPAMMVAGPVVGYALGWLVEKKWGGAPWPGVVGLLFGLVAAFRQIFLILARKSTPDKDNQFH